MNIVNPVFYFLHVVSVVFWIGGIGYILLVLMPAVPQVSLRDRARFMPIVLRRFLVIVWAAIAVLTVTGLHRLFLVWDLTHSGFFSSNLGYAMTMKLILVVVLIGIAMMVTFRAVPRARSHVKTHLSDPPDAYKCGQCGEIVGGLRRLLQIALVLALVIIYAAVQLRGA